MVDFDGERVLCSHSFVQSVNAATMIDYKLEQKRSFRERTNKYRERGFTLLVPRNFKEN